MGKKPKTSEYGDRGYNKIIRVRVVDGDTETVHPITVSMADLDDVEVSIVIKRTGRKLEYIDEGEDED